MAKSNICYHNVRLNLDNEQHCRIHKILAELNTEIHKSVNQFIVDAVDYYIRSLNDESLVKGAGEPKKNAGYITREDLDSIRSELKNEVKSEIIMLLGAALGAGTARAAEGAAGRGGMEVKAAEAADDTKETDDPTMMELVDNFGIKKKLEGIRQNVQESIADVDKSIGKIDAFGKGMREAGQKIANTFRTFADKPEKEYGEKKFSKTELIKKPFQAKRKLLSGILNCADAAIAKTEQLAADVKQYQTDKAERETAETASMEAVSPIGLARVAEPEFQYGAEAFEAHQKETAKAVANDKATKNVPIKSGKSR